MMARAIKWPPATSTRFARFARDLREICERFESMANSPNDRTSKARIVRFGGREVITEGLHLNFWADISHRCMTASWPAFIGGAALGFIPVNTVFRGVFLVGGPPVPPGA